MKNTKPDDKPKIGKGLSSLGLTFLTIIITASLTWYVNYKLSHLAPILSISNVEFTYDLKDVSDIIEMPETLISLDNEGFFGSDIKNFMRMEDLQIFSKKDRPDIIYKRYEHFEKELTIFINLLRKDEINYEVLSHYMMDFLRSNAFNGVASFLVFLEEKKRIEPLYADVSHLQSLKDKNGALKLANNLYLLPNIWKKASKTDNQKYMAGKIEFFAERMAWNLIQQNDKELLQFLDEGLNALHKSRESDIKVENGIIQFIEQKAIKYKKIKLDLLIVNRSDFPLLLLSDCKLIFNSINKTKKMITEGIIKVNDLSNEVSLNNLFNATVLNGKDNQKLVIKSVEINTNDLKAIEDLYLEKSLQVKVRIKAKTQKNGQKEFESNWLTINTSIDNKK